MATSDGLRCLLCEVDLRIVGTHLTRVHGVPVMLRSELQNFLGLPMGFRFAAEDYIDEKREAAKGLIAAGKLRPGGFSDPAVVRRAVAVGSRTRREAKFSDEQTRHQRSRLAQFRQEHVERQAREADCAGCGTRFSTTAGSLNKGRKFCSKDCAHKNIERHYPTAMLAAGIAHSQKRHEEAQEERVCVECGATFFEQRSYPKQTCSKPCERSLNRKAALVGLARMNADVRQYTVHGVSGTLPHIAKSFGLVVTTLKRRLRSGMTIDEAVQKPVRKFNLFEHCTEPGCARPVLARALCSMHYQRTRT